MQQKSIFLQDDVINQRYCPGGKLCAKHLRKWFYHRLSLWSTYRQTQRTAQHALIRLKVRVQQRWAEIWQYRSPAVTILPQEWPPRKCSRIWIAASCCEPRMTKRPPPSTGKEKSMGFNFTLNDDDFEEHTQVFVLAATGAHTQKCIKFFEAWKRTELFIPHRQSAWRRSACSFLCPWKVGDV